MIYGGDVTTLSEDDLIKCMKGLASAWRASPHLSNDYSESLRYVAIRDALAERFGVNCFIDADTHPTDYHVQFVDKQ